MHYLSKTKPLLRWSLVLFEWDTTVGSIAPEYVGAARPKMAIAPQWIGARKGVKSMGNTGLLKKHDIL